MAGDYPLSGTRSLFRGQENEMVDKTWKPLIDGHRIHGYQDHNWSQDSPFRRMAINGNNTLSPNTGHQLPVHATIGPKLTHECGRFGCPGDRVDESRSQVQTQTPDNGRREVTKTKPLTEDRRMATHVVRNNNNWSQESAPRSMTANGVHATDQCVPMSAPIYQNALAASQGRSREGQIMAQPNYRTPESVPLPPPIQMQIPRQVKRPFVCNLCGNSFSQKTSLTRHMRSHTGERPYPCPHPGCTKMFADKERIKIHMRTHTGEKPFGCDVCLKCFSQKSTVKRHMSVHTGERPFMCKVCRKGFANRGNLTAHQRTHRMIDLQGLC